MNPWKYKVFAAKFLILLTLLSNGIGLHTHFHDDNEEGQVHCVLCIHADQQRMDKALLGFYANDCFVAHGSQNTVAILEFSFLPILKYPLFYLFGRPPPSIGWDAAVILS